MFKGMSEEEKLQLAQSFLQGIERAEILKDPNRQNTCWSCKYRSDLKIQIMGYPACWGFDWVNYNNGKMKCFKEKEGSETDCMGNDGKTGFDITKIELRSGRLLFKESEIAKGLRKDEWVDADGRLWYINFRKLKAGLSCIKFSRD